ncbi:hypothetical protein INR49_013672, partial [Caranx melampygus]
MNKTDLTTEFQEAHTLKLPSPTPPSLGQEEDISFSGAQGMLSSIHIWFKQGAILLKMTPSLSTTTTPRGHRSAEGSLVPAIGGDLQYEQDVVSSASFTASIVQPCGKMQRSYRMRSAFVAVLLGVVGALANKEDCLSGQYTSSGECCKQCQPGEGVDRPCGATQTVCSPCLDSETFSENLSHTEKCQPCTKCTGLFRMETPCTDSNDAICVCDYGYYLNGLSQMCEPCTKCPEGQGMLLSCELDHDTVCEECSGDTYSDQESSREPCIPCTLCDGGEELQPCTSVSDTVCEASTQTMQRPRGTSRDRYPEPTQTVQRPRGRHRERYPGHDSTTPFMDPFSPVYEDLPSEGPTESSSTTTSGDSQERLYQGLNDKLIPIYCSILAAVVVGIVAFIIFKIWNSCKQNKQGANNCTVNQNQTPSPEGEKLHSDSGISVDSQSLQEQQGQAQAQTVVTMDEEPCLLLPLHTRERVEKLLFRGNEGDDCDHMDDSDWCNLAGLLGYEEERIATFRQEEHPVRALLSDWASKDCASIDTLCTALRKINRDDIAQSLVHSPSAAKPTATSVVVDAHRHGHSLSQREFTAETQVNVPLATDETIMRVHVTLDHVLIDEMDLVIIVKVEHQSSVLERAIAGVFSEMEGTRVEASFKQLA